jgi:hypothetical protein
VDEYDIYIRGFDKGGTEPTDIGLARVFGIDRRRARELLRSLPRVVKHHVPAAQMGRYVLALRELGADLEVRRSEILPAQTIAIRGGEQAANAAGKAQHGSTMTLPPPKPDRAPDSPARGAPPNSPPRFAQTMVARADAVAQAPSAGQGAREAAFGGDADEAEDTVADPELPPREVSGPRWGTAQVRVASPSISASKEPRPMRPGEGELPDPSLVPGLRLDGRPAWLVEGPHSLHPEPSAGQQSFEVVGDSSAPPFGSARPPARAGRPPSATAPKTIGTVMGREPQVARSALWGFALRVGVIGALLMLLIGMRQLHVLERVEDELTRLVDKSGVGASTGATAAVPASIYGPDAVKWLEPELHQVIGGDKDRVRSLAQRFAHAGAVGVHVGRITQSSVLQIAGELVVELPDDADKRKAVLDEYQRFLQGTFAGVAVAPSDPGGDLLRVAL